MGVGVGKCLSEDSLVCFGVKHTQRACVRDFPRDRKRTREGRSQAEQKKRPNRSVDRTGQSTEIGGSRQSREGSKRSRQERAVNRRRGKPTAGMSGSRRWVGQREHSW